MRTSPHLLSSTDKQKVLARLRENSSCHNVVASSVPPAAAGGVTHVEPIVDVQHLAHKPSRPPLRSTTNVDRKLESIFHF